MLRINNGSRLRVIVYRNIVFCDRSRPGRTHGKSERPLDAGGSTNLGTANFDPNEIIQSRDVSFSRAHTLTITQRTATFLNMAVPVYRNSPEHVPDFERLLHSNRENIIIFYKKNLLCSNLYSLQALTVVILKLSKVAPH